MLNAQGEVACEAHFVMGLFDTRVRKLIAPTEAWLGTFGITLEEWSARSAEGPGSTS